MNIYITQDGRKRLVADIESLQAQLAGLLKMTGEIASVDGRDLLENGSLDGHILDWQGIQQRLVEASHTIIHAELVDPPSDLESVQIGTQVRFSRNGEPEETWEIAGYGASDPDNAIIAYNTTLAKIIMGKRIGETVQGIIAGKETSFKILGISLPQNLAP